MSDVKWIKITPDIFDDEKIKMIESLPSSDTIIVIWFKLLCLAGQQNNSGVFIMNNRIAYTDEMLAAIFRRDVTAVRFALKVFVEYGMVEIIDDVLTIPNWDKYQTLDAYERKKERDRHYQQERRQKQKLLIEEKKTKKSSDTSSDVTRAVGRFCSYSYSNNSNINNLIYILNNNIHKDTQYLKDNRDLYSSIREWMEYKDKKKPYTQNHYSTEQGLLKLLTVIINNAKQYGNEAVITLIDDSISNNYQGIIWDKIQKIAAQKPKQKEQYDIEGWSKRHETK